MTLTTGTTCLGMNCKPVMNILFLGPSGCVHKETVFGNKNNEKIGLQFSDEEIYIGETIVDHSGCFIGLKNLLLSVIYNLYAV